MQFIYEDPCQIMKINTIHSIKGILQLQIPPLMAGKSGNANMFKAKWSKFLTTLWVSVR